MTTPSQGDLFFDTLVSGYVEGNSRFVRRGWLASRVEQALADTGTRFVLITAEPGAGKSAFLAQLAHDHPDWPRYFIRRDQRAVLSDVADKSLLLRVGYQLAALHPELFTTDALRLSVVQRVGTVVEDGEAIGAEVKRLVASPFYQKVIEVEQQVTANAGRIVGLQVDQLIVEPRLVPVEDLFHLAVGHPAAALDRTRPDERIVILIDALDEIRDHQTADNILDWLIHCPQLPRNVRFVLSSRPSSDALNLFRAQHAEQLKELAIDEDDPRVTDDVRHFVGALAEEPAVANALRATGVDPKVFIGTVSDKARGNLGYVGALARGIDVSISQRDAASIEALVTQKELPAELEGLYAFFLHNIKASPSVARERIELTDPETGETYDKPVWPAFYDRVLGVLAVAMEPVDLDLLLRLGGISTERAWADDALERLRQFLDVVDGRYRLYHATVGEFLTSDRTRDSADTADLFQDPRRRHRQIADRYWRQREQWTECDDYGLRNLAVHLYRGEQCDRLAGLISEPWMRARVVREDYRYSGFLADVDLASQCAAADADREAECDDGAFAAFAACFRYALIRGSVGSLSVNVPPALIERALEISLWPVARALDIASRVPRPLARAESYAAILESGTPLTDAATKDVCRAILESLNAVQAESRVEVLKPLLPRLDLEQLRDALAIARATPGPQDRADCLVVVARRLSGSERAAAVQEALEAARMSPESGARARTLTALADMVSEQARPGIVEEALAAARATSDPRQRARAFVIVASALTETDKAALLNAAADAAREIKDQRYRVEALAAIASRLPADEKAARLDDAFAMARAIRDDDDRAWALWDCMTELEGAPQANAVDDVLAAARSIKDARDRATILIALARYATGDSRTVILNEALEATQAIEEVWDRLLGRAGLADRAMRLTAISGQLTGDQKRSAIVDAVSSAMASRDPEPRARALASLAARLTGPSRTALLEQALSAARAMGDFKQRAQVLSTVASQFDDDRRTAILQEALALAADVKEGIGRAWVLLSILPMVSASQVHDVLAAARGIEEADYRASVLTQLLDRTTDLDRTAIQAETLATARAMTEPKMRAATLAYLALYVEGVTRDAALEESVAAARAIESVQDRVYVFTVLILDKVSADERAALLKDTVAAARSIQDDEARVLALARLSRVVGDETQAGIWEDVQAGVRAMKSTSAQRWLTVVLEDPSLLNDQERATALNDALAEAESSSTDERRRGDVLATLAPHLRDERRIAAAEAAALTLADPRRRLDVLLALGDAGNPAARVRQIRRSVIDLFGRSASRFSETDVLETLGTRMFTALSPGAETVVSMAGHIIEIDQQWQWL